ncbi:MAG: hypothetical protein ACYCVZ_09330, partial [Streptosporangiaceae bacterium]
LLETNALISAVQQEGTCWCGPILWKGRPAMRISISGWATSDQDIDKSAHAISAAVRRVAERDGGERVGDGSHRGINERPA